MEVEISGLKCDNPACNHRDDSVKFEDYHKHINSKCPKCGDVWLTQKEYDQCVKIYKTVEKLNKIGNVLKWINPFHYWRLFFGDKRQMKTYTKKF